jgi:hypothetical protein
LVFFKEIQRIKSEGDYATGKNLVETYRVVVEPKIHEEVLTRAKPLNLAPYKGFVNPVLVTVKDADGNITDVKVDYTSTFVNQILDYAKNYSFLTKKKLNLLRLRRIIDLEIIGKVIKFFFIDFYTIQFFLLFLKI